MADQDRRFQTSEAQTNRRPEQGLGQTTANPEPRGFEDDEAGRAQLGSGTPANVDIHKLGQTDHPEQEWGEPGNEGATYSANHTRRGVKTEAERGQGAKTRKAAKDAISRRT